MLNYPDVCTASPKTGKAFCEEHVDYLTRNHPNIPTDLRGFLAYCGIQRSDIGNQCFLIQYIQKKNNYGRMGWLDRQRFQPSHFRQFCGLMFSLNILPFFETFLWQRKIMFSVLNECFWHDALSLFCGIAGFFYLKGILA